MVHTDTLTCKYTCNFDNNTSAFWFMLLRRHIYNRTYYAIIFSFLVFMTYVNSKLKPDFQLLWFNMAPLYWYFSNSLSFWVHPIINLQTSHKSSFLLRTSDVNSVIQKYLQCTAPSVSSCLECVAIFLLMDIFLLKFTPSSSHLLHTIFSLWRFPFSKHLFYSVSPIILGPALRWRACQEVIPVSKYGK